MRQSNEATPDQLRAMNTLHKCYCELREAVKNQGGKKLSFTEVEIGSTFHNMKKVLENLARGKQQKKPAAGQCETHLACIARICQIDEKSGYLVPIVKGFSDSGFKALPDHSLKVLKSHQDRILEAIRNASQAFEGEANAEQDALTLEAQVVVSEREDLPIPNEPTASRLPACINRLPDIAMMQFDVSRSNRAPLGWIGIRGTLQFRRQKDSINEISERKFWIGVRTFDLVIDAGAPLRLALAEIELHPEDDSNFRKVQTIFSPSDRLEESRLRSGRWTWQPETGPETLYGAVTEELLWVEAPLGNGASARLEIRPFNLKITAMEGESQPFDNDIAAERAALNWLRQKLTKLEEQPEFVVLCSQTLS